MLQPQQKQFYQSEECRKLDLHPYTLYSRYRSLKYIQYSSFFDMVEWIFVYVFHCTDEDIIRKQILPVQERRKIGLPANKFQVR